MDKKELEAFKENAGNVITDVAKQDALNIVQAAEKFLLDEISESTSQREFEVLLESTLKTIEKSYRKYYELSNNGLKPKE